MKPGVSPDAKPRAQSADIVRRAAETWPVRLRVDRPSNKSSSRQTNCHSRPERPSGPTASPLCRQSAGMDAWRRTAPHEGPRSRPCPNIENDRSEEHTSELQSLMRHSYAVCCLKTKIQHHNQDSTKNQTST